MSDPDHGPYDHQYKRYYENKDAHQGYEFQHGPSGSAPIPTVPFMQKLRWWTWDRWKRLKRERAQRDRLQQEILQIKRGRPK